MIYVALGANIPATYDGDTTQPKQSLLKVLEVLQSRGVQIKATSALWQSPAWPAPCAQPAYINAVIGVETSLKPLELLKALKTIEASFGRKPSERNAPRPLDLDILDYHGLVLDTSTLTLPHPRMCERGFVLFPLAEIAPDWHDPIKNRAIQYWTARLSFNDVEPLIRLKPFSRELHPS